MNESSVFLGVLAKIMQARVNQNNEMNMLYELVKSELEMQLNNSDYPRAPEVTAELNELIGDIETAYIFNEVIGKATYRVDCVYINEGLKAIEALFVDKTNPIFSLRSYVPYIVSHSERFMLSVVNYDNNVVELTIPELKILFENSSINKIDITKLVRYVKLQMPLVSNDLCIIIDNSKHSYSELDRFVFKSILYLIGNDKEQPINKQGYDIVVNKTELYDESSTSVSNGVVKYIINNKAKIMYGFREQYNTIYKSVLLFFTCEIQQSKAIQKAITNDIARLNGEMQVDEDELKRLRKSEKDKQISFEKQYALLSNTLAKIESEITKVCEALSDKFSVNTIIPNRVFYYILNGLFYAAEAEEWNTAAECIEQLNKLQYPNINLCNDYVSCQRKEKSMVYDTSTCDSWQLAKMALAIIDPSCIEIAELKRLLNLLGREHSSTGKEIYAKAQLLKHDGNDKYISYLITSFEKGYSPSGSELMNLYLKGNKDIRLLTLANALVPEACMIIAEKNIEKRNSKRYRISLTSREMVYYKLAASKGYIPAIEKIVEIVFEERFSNAHQIWVDEYDDPKYNAMKENGQAICILCQYLIDKKVDIQRFREIKGVVLFCLNTNLNEARQLLSGINTNIANYCKGVMYEFGQGVALDLDQAIEHYKKATDFSNTEHCLNRALNKRMKKQMERNISSNYDSTNDYSRSVSYGSSSSDSWCFITTAACVALQKGDNCEELNMLRKFRDEHISDTKEGQQLVAEYYRIAPSIVARIDELPNANDEYYRLWLSYIKPSCKYIINQDWDKAKMIYVEMVKELCVNFHISVDDEISKKYSIQFAEY